MAELVHNVEDRRALNIGSWSTGPLVYDELTDTDIGRTVIYRDVGRAEAGTITSYRDGYVWARFHQGSTSECCEPDTLVFGLERIKS